MATTRSPRNSASESPVRSKRSTSSDGGSGGRGRNKKGRKPNPFWAAVRAFFNTVAILLMVIILAACAVLISYIKQTPTHIDLTFNPPGVTMIYSSDGTPLAKYYVENRQFVTIDKIPKDLQNA